MTLTLANSSVTHPLGIVEYVLVHVDGLTLFAYFMVIGMKGYSWGLVVLDCPFLATGKAKIDVEIGELVL